MDLTGLGSDCSEEGSGALSTIGRLSIKAAGAIGRGIKKFEREHPEKALALRVYLQAQDMMQEVGITMFARVMGAEQEIIANREMVGKAFEDTQRDLASFVENQASVKKNRRVLLRPSRIPSFKFK